MKSARITLLMTLARFSSQSIIAFLESDSYEDAIRKAISLEDADTMACIAGGIKKHIMEIYQKHFI